ncbi:hypothetical protein ABGB14_43480 [Nonomuraea sp. B10E15]|uniref:hypothetical protein n=1 Tax=Nonomuraea sp. B10E15 TaxID=3153560 RepID=UPI00325E1196
MLSRFAEWLYDRRMTRLREQVIAARINAGPPLPATWDRYEESAVRLAEIGPDALGAGREEVREIGNTLNDAGGKPLRGRRSRDKVLI